MHFKMKINARKWHFKVTLTSLSSLQNNKIMFSLNSFINTQEVKVGI